MRIVVDVSPLSHPPTGIGNYIPGSLGGLVTAARPAGHEVVAMAPTRLRADRVSRARWPAGMERAASNLAAPRPEAAACSAHAVESCRCAEARAPRRAARRLACSRTGCTRPSGRVCAGRWCTTSVPAHRPEWCTPRTIAMHTRKLENAVDTCDVVFTNSRHTAEDVRATYEVAGQEPGWSSRTRVSGQVFDRRALALRSRTRPSSVRARSSPVRTSPD